MDSVLCAYCKVEQDPEHGFYWSKKGQRMFRCKTCQKKYSKKWNRAHVDYVDQVISRKSQKKTR